MQRHPIALIINFLINGCFHLVAAPQRYESDRIGLCFIAGSK